MQKMINWFKTLRARFALLTAGLFLLGLSAFGVYVYGSVANGLFAALDAALTLNVSQVANGLESAGNGQFILLDSFFQEPQNAALRERGFTIRILSPAGQTLQEFGPPRVIPTPATTLETPPSFTTFTDPASQTSVRVYTAPIDEESRRIAIVQVAQSLADANDTLRRLLTTLFISVPLLVALTGLSGYFLAARALAPVDRITLTARHISAHDLSARLNLPATDDEVGRLAETFDAMLARLDDSFRRERQFTADASHELRTPLTAMQAILGMMGEKRRAPEDYEQALADLAEETDRLQALTENLLRLARGDHHPPHEVVNLSTLLQDVAASLRPLAEAKAITLICEVPDGLTLTGDSDDLIRLFVNLLDNAIKYTERGEITVSASRNRDHSLRVNVADTGIGIAAEHLPHIFDRFYRVDKARTLRGIGLGLAIALTIARAHGGTIISQSTLGKGTSFTVSFPQNSKHLTNEKQS